MTNRSTGTLALLLGAAVTEAALVVRVSAARANVHAISTRAWDTAGRIVFGTLSEVCDLGMWDNRCLHAQLINRADRMHK
jgi:hypothetical protein